MLRNPYPGLRSFEEADAQFFFGRDQSIEDILARLRDRRFVAVVGPSGCGKSSLIKAGVLPNVRRMPEFIGTGCPDTVVIRPGAAPLTNLTRALVDDAPRERHASSPNIEDSAPSRDVYDIADGIRKRVQSNPFGCLIVVEQFEEIFRYVMHSGESEADLFVGLLLDLTKLDRVSVVLTTRADFVGDCVRFDGLAEALNAGQYLLPRLSRAQIREVIESPAQCSGLSVEPSLVRRIMEDIGSDPDQLPLMQHVLRRTCERALSATGTVPHVSALSLRDYCAVGGIQESLSQQADEIFEELASDDAKQLCESMFRCLTEKLSTGYAVRRPTPAGIVAAGSGVDIGSMLEIAAAFREKGEICWCLTWQAAT
jgi:energy-coupling factor transporter ATP-binding protein EcfA2